MEMSSAAYASLDPTNLDKRGCVQPVEVSRDTEDGLLKKRARNALYDATAGPEWSG
jgi:hypothetical protein